LKKCKICKDIKDESFFYGVQGECKECTKSRVKSNSARVGSSYDFSEKGVIRVIYKTQKRHNTLRGFGELPYSKKQLCDWMYNNNFKCIFDDWTLSGNKKGMKPSIDRIDDFKGYSFKNITIGTWDKNREHQHNDIRSGKGTGGLRCKSLLKIDINQNVVCEYVSYSSAVRDMGYSLEYQIKKSTKCRNGFFWKYK